MIYPTPNEPPSPTLNAITAKPLLTDPAHETAEEERIRHMRTCQELIELGMNLAREAAHQALHVMQARAGGPSIPTSSAAAIEEAEARARQRQPNYGLVFAQISRSVRQCIALQAHIRAGALTPCAKPPGAGDPRPHPSRPSPNRPESCARRDATEHPDWALPTSPDGDINVEHALQTIRNSLTAVAEAGAPEQDPPQVRGPDTPAHRPRHPAHGRPAAPKSPSTWRPPVHASPEAAERR